MTIQECTEIGVIQRKQGLKGAVLALLHQEAPQLENLKSLWIQIDHTLIPYVIEHLSLQHQRVLLKLRGVDSPTAAHSLKSCPIFVPKGIISNFSEPSLQLMQLIGYEVTDIKEGSLGKVQDIYQPAQQYLLEVDYQGKELLIPYHEDIVTQVDPHKRHIQVQLPKGFIESAF